LLWLKYRSNFIDKYEGLKIISLMPFTKVKLMIANTNHFSPNKIF